MYAFKTAMAVCVVFACVVVATAAPRMMFPKEVNRQAETPPPPATQSQVVPFENKFVVGATGTFE